MKNLILILVAVLCSKSLLAADEIFIRSQLHLLPDFLEVTHPEGLDFKKTKEFGIGNMLRVYFQEKDKKNTVVWNRQDVDFTRELCMLTISVPLGERDFRPTFATGKKIVVSSYASEVINDPNRPNDHLSFPYLNIAVLIDAPEDFPKNYDVLSGSIDCGYGKLHGSNPKSPEEMAGLNAWFNIRPALEPIYTSKRVLCGMNEYKGFYLYTMHDPIKIGGPNFFGDLEGCSHAVVQYDRKSHSPFICAPGSTVASDGNKGSALYTVKDGKKLPETTAEFKNIDTCYTAFQSEGTHLICAPKDKNFYQIYDGIYQKYLPAYYNTSGSGEASCFRDTAYSEFRFVCIPRVSDGLYQIWDRKESQALGYVFNDANDCRTKAREVTDKTPL